MKTPQRLNHPHRLLAASIAAGVLLLPLGAAANPSEAKSADKAAQDQTITESARDTAADLRIHLALETKLAQSDELSALEIGTDVMDGVVHLEGEVDSKARKELATELARSVEGVQSVRNDLVVLGSEPGMLEKVQDTAGEAVLSARVKTRLLTSENTSGWSISVSSEGDVVTLEGEVGSNTEKELAELIAGNTSGVAKVQNRLTVKPPAQ